MQLYPFLRPTVGRLDFLALVDRRRVSKSTQLVSGAGASCGRELIEMQLRQSLECQVPRVAAGKDELFGHRGPKIL